MIALLFSSIALRALLVGKVVVAFYWAWVIKSLVFPTSDVFELFLSNTAPMLLGLHFLQFVVFLRRLGLAGTLFRDLALTLLFGMLHLVPKIISYNAARSRPRG